MRFTKKGGKIDQEKAEREMTRAIEGGVNYFDTAYLYPGSEVSLGAFLAKGRRKDVFIATKLPHYLIKAIGEADRIFDEELKRLQTDYIDYYLIHMLTDVGSWERLKRMGIEDWIARRKADGRIRNIGFSFHGGGESFLKLVDAYDWDFCQIQYNYMDEYSQAGRRGLEYAAEQGLPVIIMEPLRGGRLVNGLPAGAKRAFEQAEPKRSPAEWALRWIWNHPQATVVLSGMNSMEQVDENIRAASEARAGALTGSELQLFETVREELNRVTKIGCTGCGYCLPCPQGVDIPTCFRTYNVKYADGWKNALREYVMCTTLRPAPSNASLCVQCGKCERKCPQSIEIRAGLAAVKKELEGPLYKIIKRAAKIVSRF